MSTAEPGSSGGPPRIRPLRQQAVSVHDQALLEMGKSLVSSSTTVGREFAKTMVPVCTGAVTLYFAALKAVAPHKSQFNVWDGLVVAIPPVAFVLASAFFVAAFTPRLSRLSLNVIADLSSVLDAIIVKQHRWNKLALWTFLLATALASVGLAVAMVRWQA